MPPRQILAVLLLCGCQSPDHSRPDVAPDLSAALQPAVQPRDTAAERADSQFQTCLYVYDSAEKLRECLVIHNHWMAENAERRIAVWRAGVQRKLDSIEVARRFLQDSIRLTRQLKTLKESNRRSKIFLDAADKRYWGARSTHLFYANVPSCDVKRLIDPDDLMAFRSREEAEEAGYERVTRADC
jgi:hypothetical protein